MALPYATSPSSNAVARLDRKSAHRSVLCYRKSAQENQITRDAAIYALDPLSLNKEADIQDFPVTWVQGPVLQTIKFAFDSQNELVDGQKMPYLELPVAIYPPTIHSRISSQKSGFTLHGNDKRDFETIFINRSLIRDKRLIKYRIPKEGVELLAQSLWKLGITRASLFPDLDGLAKELKYGFGIKG